MADNKRPNLVRRVIAEMQGKIAAPLQNGFWFGGQKLFNRATTTEVSYDRNDYDLWRSIFYNSVVNKKGKEYQVAAALGKPIVDITAGFVVGRGCTIALANDNNDPQIQRMEDKINKWLKKNQGILLNTAKYTYRDGDAYVHMDEFGKLKELDAKGVEVILDPVSGEVMGCDVKQTVWIQDLAISGLPTGTSTEYTYVKQYRKNSIRIYRFVSNQPENKEVIWEKVYTQDGAVSLEQASQYSETGENLGIPYGTLIDRRLAVKMMHNEPDAQAVYGNSDYQNVLTIFRDYSEVIMESKGSVIYNSSPIPVLRGVMNRKQLEAQSHAGDPATTPTGQASEDQGFAWGKDKVLYLNGEKADAKMLQGNGVMDDAAKLLEIYFYLFVQGTETPEFVFGTAVSSSKASTETQIPIFVTKIERKQTEFAAFIEDLVETYIERRMLISDPDYLALVGQEIPEISVSFPPIADEDKQLTLETVQWAFENNMLQAQTALELLLGDKVKNISEEIKRAAAEAKEAAKNAAPAQSDRLVSELLKKASSTATNPSQNPTNTPPEPTES